MPLPGIEVNIIDTPPPFGDPSDSGLLFVIGESLKGPVGTSTEIRSLEALDATYGERAAYGVARDAIEVFFQAGGARVVFSRIVGPAATSATVNLPAASGTSLVATAASPGEWANGHTMDVIVTGGTFYLLMKDGAGKTIERSPTFADKASAIAWAATSPVFNLTAGAGSGNPVAGTALAFSTATSDRANITTDEEVAALEAFTEEQGIGQLTAPGRTSEALHLAMLAYGETHRRFCVLDADPTFDGDDLEAYAGVLRDGESGRWGTIAAPRVVVRAPGQSRRLVPASTFWAARAAVTDFRAGPGQPPAGALYGQSNAILDIETVYTDAERTILNEAGVCVIHRVNGSPRIYGSRTLANSLVEPAYRWVNGTRVVMAFQAKGKLILENYVQRRIDGKRTILNALSNDLNGLAETFYVREDLYGDTSADAYVITVADPVNTDQSLADGYLRAAGEIRVPPVAERVRFDLAVRSSGDQISTPA